MDKMEDKGSIGRSGEEEGKGGEKGWWWDVDFRLKKREVRRKLREWRRKRGDGGEYRVKRRELCERRGKGKRKGRQGGGYK